MGKIAKLLIRILSGTADQNIKFSDLVHLLDHLGFEGRVKGSHHIYWREGVAEIINIQPRGALAKPYQVKQLRALILRYKLAGDIYGE